MPHDVNQFTGSLTATTTRRNGIGCFRSVNCFHRYLNSACFIAGFLVRRIAANSLYKGIGLTARREGSAFTERDLNILRSNDCHHLPWIGTVF